MVQCNLPKHGKRFHFPKSYSETRWWSKYKMLVQVHDLFGDIPAFVNGGQIPEVTARKLQDLLFSLHIIKLEGDGSPYQIVRKLEAEMRSLHFPNCSAVIRNIANGNIALQRRSETYVMAFIQPAYDYFTSKFLNNGDQLQPAVEIFKAARLFNPTKIAEIQPTAAILSDQLRNVPFLNNDACIDGLQRELPTYIAVATDVNPDINVLTWWEIHEEEIPNWAKACKKILLIQPSSAASERVFSLLENYFRDNQACVMEEYIEASIMLQYDQR